MLIRMPAMMLMLTLFCTSAAAHEGHEHPPEAADGAAIFASAAPRLALQSARIELVAVREPAALLIYVDDYASNAPLAGLRVQVRVGAQSLQAESVASGLYQAPADLLGGEAQTVEFLVQGEGWQERLSGTLPAAAAVRVIEAPSNLRTWFLGAGAILLAGFALALGLRRSRKT